MWHPYLLYWWCHTSCSCGTHTYCMTSADHSGTHTHCAGPLQLIKCSVFSAHWYYFSWPSDTHTHCTHDVTSAKQVAPILSVLVMSLQLNKWHTYSLYWWCHFSDQVASMLALLVTPIFTVLVPSLQMTRYFVYYWHRFSWLNGTRAPCTSDVASAEQVAPILTILVMSIQLTKWHTYLLYCRCLVSLILYVQYLTVKRHGSRDTTII